MNKKGAELTLNVMIILIILLIALIVLVIIFSGKTSIFSKTTGGCQARGGSCMDGEECPLGYAPAALGAKLCNSGQVCCILLEGNAQ